MIFSIQASQSHYFLTTKPLSFKFLSLGKQISSFSTKALSAITNPLNKKVTDYQNPATFPRTFFLQVTKRERAPLSTANVKSKLQEKPPRLNQTNPHPQNEILLN
ncbi:hypothetical protein CEXT_313821 [Caerostris extrusa]|uniref:Uncharacterized protein n=1 Tax=Caerostris extrusa TaxID=172846 RepID=A0AAV4QII9_CAEEX|nr:hypothetical protein CEXT_313821 [Caerostris extrusa]